MALRVAAEKTRPALKTECGGQPPRFVYRLSLVARMTPALPVLISL